MRKIDIRPTELFDEHLRLSAEDAAQFVSDTSGFKKRVCPGCGACESALAFRKVGFIYERCSLGAEVFSRPPA